MLRILKPAAILALLLTVSSCGFKRKKYENPITKDTQQPDKVLFDRAIRDIEHGRYEVARLTLNTLINTYDASEFLAKAKLAIADSWYREGGTHGLAQAEAEFKDFILFYPAMEEAAESQQKICDIHIRQMEKADRDPNNALRAEMECKTLITQFPNSKYVPGTEQKLRQIQEALASAEMIAGDFYHHKGANAAAANRFTGLVDQYPLYSGADEALWKEADSYSKMGNRFRPRQGEALAKIVKDYPLSPYVDLAKKKLKDLEIPIPEADPAQVARMKWERENRTKPGIVTRSTGFLKRGPDTSLAAKSGAPTMGNPKQSIPVSVPPPPGSTTSNEVTIAPVTNSSALDTEKDARPAGAAAGATAAPATGTPAANTTTPAADPKAADTSKSKKTPKKNKKKSTTNTIETTKPTTQQ